MNLVAKRGEQESTEPHPAAVEGPGKQEASLLAVQRHRLRSGRPHLHRDLVFQGLATVRDDHVGRARSDPRGPESRVKIRVRLARKVGVRVDDGHARNRQPDERVVALRLERHPVTALERLVGKVGEKKLDRVKGGVLFGAEQDPVVLNHFSQFRKAPRVRGHELFGRRSSRCLQDGLQASGEREKQLAAFFQPVLASFPNLLPKSGHDLGGSVPQLSVLPSQLSRDAVCLLRVPLFKARHFSGEGILGVVVGDETNVILLVQKDKEARVGGAQLFRENRQFFSRQESQVEGQIESGVCHAHGRGAVGLPGIDGSFFFFSLLVGVFLLSLLVALFPGFSVALEIADRPLSSLRGPRQSLVRVQRVGNGIVGVCESFQVEHALKRG